MNNIPRQKMGKRAKKELDVSSRNVWSMSPITRMKPSKKVYDRKRRSKDQDVF
jgi:hypothetical protein